MPAIRVAHVEVRRDRIVADVCVSDERFVRTTPRLIASLLPRYPHLLEHCCVNDRGTTFAAVAAGTSTPHLLEHMSIENQVRAEGGLDAGLREGSNAGARGPASGRGSDAGNREGASERDSDSAVRRRTKEADGAPAEGIYVGKTKWTDRAARLARVELSYADDLIALAALRDATRDLDEALASMRL